MCAIFFPLHLIFNNRTIMCLGVMFFVSALEFVALLKFLFGCLSVSLEILCYFHFLYFFHSFCIPFHPETAITSPPLALCIKAVMPKAEDPNSSRDSKPGFNP